VPTRVLVFAALLGTVGLGHLLRTSLGVDELTTQGVRVAVERLGVLGPLVFLGLVVFRQLLGIPAVLILATGGLCFGAPMGTALGASGIVVSGAGKFGIARWLGREFVRRRFGTQMQVLDRRIDRLGPVVIGLSTAHPLGILAPFHWGAGLSSLSFRAFALALVLGAPVRAFALSTFGASLAGGSTPRVWAITAGITFLLLAPMGLPAVRRQFGFSS
jgi:uncharacterized membrane protein YdjX (TVP38/TMEM64 family)